MWIRSQNRKVLVTSDYVEIMESARSDGKFCNECEIITKNSSGYITIGVYSTKEKALKVLDMIQEHINSGGRLFCIDQQKGDFGYTATYEKKLGVFQMPLDEDLEDET